MSRETLVPLGVVVSVVLAMAGGAVWLNGTLQRIDFALSEIRREVQQLDNKMNGQWQRHDMIQWVRLLQATNPDLKVPLVQ